MERVIMAMISTSEVTKDAAYGGATAFGGILLYISENPYYAFALFVLSVIPVAIRFVHSNKKRKEEHERHEAEMRLMDLEQKIKEKKLEL